MASAAAAAAAVAAHASAAEGSSQHEREEHQLVETAEGTDSSPLLAFLRVDEYLVDIGDDLTDYEVSHDADDSSRMLLGRQNFATKHLEYPTLHLTWQVVASCMLDHTDRR